MKNTFQLTIVGGGPVGLYAALQASRHDIDFILLESQDKLGGQLMELYPEKEIIDLSGHESILAKDYINWLLDQFDETAKTKLLTNRKVAKIKESSTGIDVYVDNTVYHAQDVIIATGLGVYMPRLLECTGSEGCRNIIYALHRLDFLKDKRVAILGGGNSALDWARDISKVTPHVTLIHRRRDFRGDQSVIEGIKTLKVLTPYMPVRVKKNIDTAYELIIEHVEDETLLTLDIDFIFVNYGHIPVSASFGLAKKGPGLLVDEMMQTSMPHVYSVGDVCNYENKKRRIDAGIHETDIVFKRLTTMSR